ncbi:MAG: Mur ligase family protein, partial [Acidobacteriota bacterium]
MDFAAAESYLFSLGNEVETMKLGLGNIRKLLGALGDPHKNYVKVQVAGTNGKGSVCAFLDSICLQAEIHTGRYTSPHLISITERVKIDGVDIAESEFAQLATRVRETSEKLVSDGKLERLPTFFEQVTAIALLAFAEAKVELAILETGLGGRFDAVTAAEAEIAAITRIDLDHQEYLGETLKKIAIEKAAIVRSGSKVVVCDQSRIAMKVILGRCSEVGAKARLTSQFLGQGFGLPALGLLGMHQTENAEVAMLLAYTLRDHFAINDEAVTSGLEKARHPGRLEYQGRYLFDGAHNIGGARALSVFLDESEARRITLIFGAMKDKDLTEIA